MEIERLDDGTVRFIINERYASEYDLTFSDVLNYKPVKEDFYFDMFQEAEEKYGVMIKRTLFDHGVGYCKLHGEECLCIDVEPQALMA